MIDSLLPLICHIKTKLFPTENKKSTKKDMDCKTPKKFEPLMSSTLRPEKRRCSHDKYRDLVVRRSYLKTEDNKRRYSLALQKSADLLESESTTPNPKRIKRQSLSINNWLETREYKCHVCDKKFFHKSAQVAHSLTHTSTPPLKRRTTATIATPTSNKKKTVKSLVRRLKLKLTK